MSSNFEEFLDKEVGAFEDDGKPKPKSTLAQKRAAERQAKMEEHKKNLQKAKAAAKPRAKFDRSKLNTNFFNNAKTNKDENAGWAFDFDNPDAGKKTEDAILTQVKEASLQDLAKSNEQPKIEPIVEQPPQNKSAEPKTTESVKETDPILARSEQLKNLLEKTSEL